uniref:Uncharacterized protein n=1 Tax=Anguilla anguilla TaxID=7936 RepID=A0A0E9UC97_ANGAN
MLISLLSNQPPSQSHSHSLSQALSRLGGGGGGLFKEKSTQNTEWI